MMKTLKNILRLLNELNSSLGLKDLSMGMSSDYEQAIESRLLLGSEVLFLVQELKIF